MNLEEDLALLLTATIDTKGMPRAFPVDPEERQKNYWTTLEYYLTHHPRVKKIIFVENSGWQLDTLKAVAQENPWQKRIEFISLNCNDFPRQFSKGYGEAVLIDRALERSEIVRTVTHFAKVTGRICLLNLTQLVESCHQYYDCFCDFKDQGWILRRMMGNSAVGPHCDTRFLIFSLPFYRQYIQPLHARHDRGGFIIESQFYQAIKAAKPKARVIDRFPVEPYFQGVAGHYIANKLERKDYSSQHERNKAFFRDILRRTLPFIHL